MSRAQAVRSDELWNAVDAADRLNDKDFARISQLISRHAGIKLPPAKRVMVEGRLRRRTRALGYHTVGDYCAFMFEHGGLQSEFVHLLNAVTTNKTDFFREPEHFTLLQKELVPELLTLRRPMPPTLKFWSAASSTGAEAYTIAMVMAEMAANERGLGFQILGTDISTEVLEQAQRGIYAADMVAPVPPEICRRYVMRGRTAQQRNAVRIVPELRRKVRFARLNLMDERYPFDRDMDVIFVRNVLIYFDSPTQRAVSARLAEHLRPGGFLIFGHSESTIGSGLKMRQRAPAVFQRI